MIEDFQVIRDFGLHFSIKDLVLVFNFLKSLFCLD
jgi:hypothetical protein